MSKFDFNVPNKPAPHNPALTRRAAAVVPTLVTATAAAVTAAAFLLTGGCGSGGGKTVSPLPATGATSAPASGTTAATGRVVVSLQWPDLTTASADSRRISSAVRRVDLFVTNTTSTDPKFILFQQAVTRTQDSGATQTVVFPAVPLTDNIHLTAVARDENGLVIATATQPIDKTKSGTQAVHLSLTSTAASISTTNEPDYEEFTQSLVSNAVGIPVGASRIFTVSAKDAGGQGVFLAPDDLQIAVPDGFSQPTSLGGSRYRITANPDASGASGTVNFSVKGSSVVSTGVAVAGTENVSVSELNIKAGANTPPLTKIGKGFVRAQTQALTFNFTTLPKPVPPKGTVDDAVNVQVRYVDNFDTRDPNYAFADYVDNNVTFPGAVLTFNGQNGVYQGAFNVSSGEISVTNRNKPVNAGTAAQPVLYQIILTGKNGTGRAVIPVLVNGGSDFKILGPGTFYKNTPSATFTAPAPDGVDFSLAGPTPDAFAFTNPTAQGVSLQRIGTPQEGQYTVTAVRRSTGQTDKATFTVPPVKVTITDAAGATVDPAIPYLLQSVRQTFTAYVSGLDPSIAGKGVTWGPDDHSLSNTTDFSVTYQLPSFPAGYDPAKSYPITATSNDDKNNPLSSTTFQIKIDPRYLNVTIQ